MHIKDFGVIKGIPKYWQTKYESLVKFVLICLEILPNIIIIPGLVIMTMVTFLHQHLSSPNLLPPHYLHQLYPFMDHHQPIER
jgi:hypothetical protein